MANRIVALGDEIQIQTKFVSGHRIVINGSVEHEGKLKPEQPVTIAIGPREYRIELRPVGSIAKVMMTHLEITENGVKLHSGVYDAMGKPVSANQAKANAAVQVCGLMGAACGVAIMLSLNMSSGGVVPGGAVGGAIGGGVGGAIGAGIGSLLFGRRK